jgi:Chaperone of endosialidase
MTTFTTQEVRRFLFTEQFARQRFSPTAIASFMMLAALLLPPNLSLYGQDALNIDPNGNLLIGGNVGIGTKSSNQKLDVTGNATINGKVGIGTNASDFPLTFANIIGDKISLWSDAGGSYGFGLAADTLQIHTSKPGTNIVFGYGKSDALKETMRLDSNGKLNVKGALAVDGNVGIGTNASAGKLDVNGDVDIQGKLAISGDKEYLRLNQDKAFTKGVHTRHLFSSGSLNVGGVDGWADPGDGNVDVAGTVRIRKNLYVDGNVMYFDHEEQKKWVRLWARKSEWEGWKEATAPSDLRLKSELQPIPSALDKIHKLRGVTFQWNEEGLQYLTRDIATTLSAGPAASDEENRKMWQAERDKRYKDLSTTNVGVIAQDVEAVLPEAVTTDETGYKSVNYYELIPLVIEALKEEDKICQEQGRTIERQQMEMQQLTVANQAAQEQLKELQGVKERLVHLEAAVNKFLASGVSEDQHELTSANPALARDHSEGAGFVTDSEP